MPPKGNTLLLEPPTQRSCHLRFCWPDIQHADSGEQGRGAPAHHHQQHREHQRWAQTLLSRGSTLELQTEPGQCQSLGWV